MVAAPRRPSRGVELRLVKVRRQGAFGGTDVVSRRCGCIIMGMGSYMLRGGRILGGERQREHLVGSYVREAEEAASDGSEDESQDDEEHGECEVRIGVCAPGVRGDPATATMQIQLLCVMRMCGRRESDIGRLTERRRPRIQRQNGPEHDW